MPDAEIVGVDIEPQPNYPHAFIQGDAMTFPLDGFDIIHASPPCQDHSKVAGRARKVAAFGTKWMLEATVERLGRCSVPWFVENVEGTQRRMDGAPHRFMLCGSMFGLDVRRHRWFASNVDIAQPACNHAAQTPRFRSLNIKNARAGKLASVVGVHGNCNYAGEFEVRCRAMGVDWMSNAELVQSIPPAYTEWIAHQLMKGEA